MAPVDGVNIEILFPFGIIPLKVAGFQSKAGSSSTSHVFVKFAGFRNSWKRGNHQKL